MKLKCCKCGCQLNENNRIRFPYCEAFICDNCNYTVTIDELKEEIDIESKDRR